MSQFLVTRSLDNLWKKSLLKNLRQSVQNPVDKEKEKGKDKENEKQLQSVMRKSTNKKNKWMDLTVWFAELRLILVPMTFIYVLEIVQSGFSYEICFNKNPTSYTGSTRLFYKQFFCVEHPCQTAFI